MINDKLMKSCASLLKSSLLFATPTDVLLSKFFRENRGFKIKERGILAETIYVFLRNYNKITAIIAPSQPYNLIAYIWLHWLKIPVADLRWLTMINLDAIISLPLANADIIELPGWVVAKLQIHMQNAEIMALSKSMGEQAPTTLRVNTLKLSVKEALKQLKQANIEAFATKYSPYGITLARKTDLLNNQLFLNGTIEVQDEASQLAGLLLEPRRGEMVVDFCAGSGGKTLLFGMLMKNSGRIYAFDINEHRLLNLSPRLSRSGLSNIYPQVIASENDSKIKRLFGKIDRVFIDAPCLGFGTLRRNPDLKFRQTEEMLPQITHKQMAILNAASKLLKPGGRLVYATCSILYEENQAIVEQFLAVNPEFSLVAIDSILEVKNLQLKDKFFLTLSPVEHGTDGFFAAALEKSK